MSAPEQECVDSGLERKRAYRPLAPIHYCVGQLAASLGADLHCRMEWNLINLSAEAAIAI
jgi:hypothetical protein